MWCRSEEVQRECGVEVGELGDGENLRIEDDRGLRRGKGWDGRLW